MHIGLTNITFVICELVPLVDRNHHNCPVHSCLAYCSLMLESQSRPNLQYIQLVLSTTELSPFFWVLLVLVLC